MPRLRLVLLLALTLLLPACASSRKKPTTRPTPMKVLFIGNSYTNYNGGLPNALNQLSKGELDCTGSVGGGKSLAWHYNQGNAIQMINSRKWDAVVLQDYSTQTLEKPELFFLFARRFHQLIKTNGAETVFYMTWPRADRLEDGERIYDAYTEAAAEANGKLAPVGLAWRAARKMLPQIQLYREDNSHPTPSGTYLAACVFYATLLDRSPLGLSNYVVNEKGKPVILITPEQAKSLQETAELLVHPAPQH